MDHRDRLTAKEALCHAYFDGIRRHDDEQMCQDYRSSQINLRRLDSANPQKQALPTNQDSSRSRSGLRNNMGVIKVTGAGNFNQQTRKNGAAAEEKSRSQGRKQE